ncbi:TPT-domain-containing protein [Meredithblackwellia eburnea MCA 4105]
MAQHLHWQVQSTHNQHQTSPSTKPLYVPPWLIIILWIALSTAVILVNREILAGTGEFPYPVTLTTLHLSFQVIATRLLHRYTFLVAPETASSSSSGGLDYAPLPTSNGDEPETSSYKARVMRAKMAAVHLDWHTWKREIVPPAFLFSISLVLSNWAYLYLTVSYIHMLKAFAPVAILLAAFAFGTKTFSPKLIVIVLVISFGTGLASYGESAFSFVGFMIQATAIAVEATRVTLIQLLLSGKDMSPLKTLYFFAPVCLAFNASLIIPFEGFDALKAIPKLGFGTIVFNCGLTFLLNISAVYLIGISSMVLSLTKVIKDILLVAGSTIFLGERLTALQGFGYAIATVGLIWYKTTPS